MHVSSNGQGQVLLFPYYTVNQQNSTLVSLSNHTAEVKALKVRFVEALNGRDALTFNLYLGPHASWRTVLIADDESDAPLLLTQDSACTAPRIPAEGVNFRNTAYVGSWQDDGSDLLDRTREGSIEVIEMGVVVDDGDDNGPRLALPDAPDNRTGVDNMVEGTGRRYATAATPVNGQPPGCNALLTAWNGGVWDLAPGTDIDEPSGGISGTAVIVDVQAGVSFMQRAEALDGFYTVADSGALHAPPGSAQPTLASAKTRAQGAVAARVGDSVLLWREDTPNAVSSVLMGDRVFNRFDLSQGLDADSEWVVTFPTKHLHIEGDGADPVSRRPFTDNFDDAEAPGIFGNAPDTSVFDPDGSCEPAVPTIRTTSGEAIEDLICIPLDPNCEPRDEVKLCYQSNVIAFGGLSSPAADETAILGARRIARDLVLPDEVVSGDIELALGDEDNFMIADPEAPAGSARDRLFGLPAIGFWAARFVNGNAQPGVLASYAVGAPHTSQVRRDRVIVTDESSPGGITPVPES